MTDTPRYRTLRDYLAVLRSNRWLILVVTIVFAGGSYALWSTQVKTYSAEASIACKDPVVDDSLTGGGAAPRRTPENEASLCAETVTSNSVRSVVARELPAAGSVEARRESTTNLVVISASARTPELAARIANQYAQQTIALRTRIERRRLALAARSLRRRFKQQRAASRNDFTSAIFGERVARVEALRDLAQPVTLVESASARPGTATPDVPRNTILGALVGLTLGVLAAFLRDALDVRLRRVGDIQSELGLPLLAAVGEESLGTAGMGSEPGRRKGRRLRKHWAKDLPESDHEAFRILRRNLDFLAGENARAIAITSAAEGEGKSTVAIWLARAYAASGHRTVLIDADLRRGVLAARLGLNQSPGVVDHVSAAVPRGDLTQRVGSRESNGSGEAPLNFIAAGSQTDRPPELLSSLGFQRFLTSMITSYDRVVVDTSPLLPVADTLEVLGLVDCAVLCVRDAETKQSEAGAALAALGHFPGTPVGLVITGAKNEGYPSYGYYRRPAATEESPAPAVTGRTPTR